MYSQDIALHHIPEIQNILKQNLQHLISFRQATFHEDTNEGFDYVVKAEETKIAIRIRNDQGYRDFTIRSQLPSGRPTELQKIQAGKGDFYLYCWKKNEIVDWMLIDLDKARASGIFERQWKTKWNSKGSLWERTAFIIIPKKELKESLISQASPKTYAQQLNRS